MTMRNATATYDIAIKLIDDTLKTTKFTALDYDTALELSEGIYNGTMPHDDWAGVVVIDNNGDIDKELEW
jgi:hypothetical protein